MASAPQSAASGTASSSAKPVWRSSRTEAFVHVGDCSAYFSWESQAGCSDLLVPIALPAIDASGTRVAIATYDEHGLGTRPNLAIRIVSTKTGALLDTMTVFAEADYGPFEDAIAASAQKADPRPMQALQTAMDAGAAVAEAKLKGAGYTTASTCTPDPASTNDSPYWCGGYDRWTCGDVDVVLTGPATSQLHTSLSLKHGTATKKLSTSAWRLPPVKYADQPPNGKIETFHCIASALRIPGTARILLDVHHACLGGGDWCAPGNDTQHIVEAP